MKSLEDCYQEIIKDPGKLAVLFKVVWISAYLMLILGFFLILWVFYVGE